MDGGARRELGHSAGVTPSLFCPQYFIASMKWVSNSAWTYGEGQSSFIDHSGPLRGLEGIPNCVSGDRSGAGKLSVTVGMEVLVHGDRVPMITLSGGFSFESVEFSAYRLRRYLWPWPNQPEIYSKDQTNHVHSSGADD